jgi:hypothetical protein
VAPIALPQLVFEGLVPEIPPDPFGGTLYIGAEGRVRSSVNPQRFDRPREDDRLGAARGQAWSRLKALEGLPR